MRLPAAADRHRRRSARTLLLGILLAAFAPLGAGLATAAAPGGTWPVPPASAVDGAAPGQAVAWVEPTPLRPFAGPVIHTGSAGRMLPAVIITPTPLRPFLGPEIHFIP
ncbi:hypothetical protein ACFVUS_09400 [Nocardia sp. NPDC058058]|uniref:hypothetical protein n=1 Tax=Nocardia sp. NPDC058058 TaxID=3346317 RepID=UPI0036D8B88E